MIKMLMFDYRESEKKYLNDNIRSDFDITFRTDCLNEYTELSEDERNNTTILSIFINSKIDENILQKFKNLQIITTRSTGYNHIDIEACRKRNISVYNIGDYGRTSVAQYTIGIILSMIRNVISASNDVRNRHIVHEKYEGRDISKLSLGIIGTGSIGSAVCELANIFGMKIYAHDIKINKNISKFVEYVSFHELLRKSDIVSLHIPYIKECHHMISKKEFEIMKKGSYLINTARGELVDTKALYEAIKVGKLKGVALDVVECERLNSNIDDFEMTLKSASCDCLESALLVQKLMEFENVIITPHIAYNTQESVEKILEIMFNDLKNYYKGIHTNRVC